MSTLTIRTCKSRPDSSVFAIPLVLTQTSVGAETALPHPNYQASFSSTESVIGYREQDVSVAPSWSITDRMSLPWRKLVRPLAHVTHTHLYVGRDRIVTIISLFLYLSLFINLFSNFTFSSLRTDSQSCQLSRSEFYYTHF